MTRARNSSRQRTGDGAVAAGRRSLLNEEETLRLLIDAVKDYAFYMLDREGNVATWNAAAERIEGYTAEEVVGRHFSMFYMPEDREAGLPQQALDTALESGRLEVENWRLRKDGSRFWADVVITPIRDEDGTLRGYAKIMRDVTERRQAEERLRLSEERFRSLVEQSVDGIVITEASGRIALANRAAARMFGYAEGDLEGRLVDELLPVPSRAVHAAHRTRFHDDPQPRPMGGGLQLMALRRDGSEFPVDVGLTPLQTREGRAVAASVRDITERKQAEEELSRRAEELARSNAELEQFAYVASHDLQEPLRMVSYYTQLLARRYQGRLDEDADTFIAFAVEGASHMQQLINDLLDFSRVGTKGKEFHPVAAKAAVERALLNLGATLAEAGAEVAVGELPSVRGHDAELMRLFQNLIGNAVKFRGEAPPRVEISAQREGDDWHFLVSDNGIGIDERYWERIFVIFQRLHPRGDHAGTGIGLALCRRIVERHGGRIWVESTPGKGTTFHFTLPAVPGARREALVAGRAA